MANSLGSLRVSLGLDAAEFSRGLTRAEYQTQQFSKNINASIRSIGAVLGSLAIGAQVIESTKAIIGEAAALNDLADATGSSVESLSRLNNQAKIAGTDFATMQAAVLKLSQGMAGADEESGKAKEALRILGITTRDPVQALQEVAVKLNTYADGVNKVGFAVALFGKQGAQFLATLKDIAELQDVGATVSAKQAAEAENLEKAYRRLSYESTAFKNAILSDVVPALTVMISEMSEGIRIAGGFGAALRLFGTLNPFEVPREGIKQLQEEIKNLGDSKLTAGRFGAGELAEIDAMIADRRKQIAFLSLQERNAIKFDPSDSNVRDQILLRKPVAPNPPGSSSGGRTKADVDEAQRYLDGLLKTQQATLDLTAEETARVAIFDIEARSMKAVSAEIKEQILDSARQIDQAKAADLAAKDRAKALADVIKEEERYEELQKRKVEEAKRDAASIESTNEHMREQIIFLKGGQDALDAYTAAKLEKIAADKEEKALIIELSGGNLELAAAYREGAAALRAQKRLLGDTRVAEQALKDAEAIKKLQNDAFDIAGSAVESLIVNGGKASDVLKQLERDLVSFITRQALLNIKDSAFGTSSGPNLFSLIPQLFGLFAGGAGVAGVGGFSGGGFGEHFASGGVSRGGLALVGENGPELRQLAAGDRIYSNSDTRKMLGGGNSVAVHQTINVMPGADTRTARQAARDAGIAAQRAISRG